MLKKTILICLALTISQNSLAETCPTIQEIKHDQFHGWQALNIDSANPISAKQLNTFKNNVQYFALAEWMEDAPEGSGHCYYHGHDIHSADYLGVFLAKANLTAAAGYDWQSKDPYVKHCNTGIDACVFQTESRDKRRKPNNAI
jgi:hypothetical protein